MTTIDTRPQYTPNDEGGEEVLDQEIGETEEATSDESEDSEENADEVTSTDSEEAEQETPAEEAKEEETDVDTKQVTPDEISGLEAAKQRLSAEIVELRKQRRGLKEQPKDELFINSNSDLSDVADSDIQLIERVLEAKGYVRKDQLQSQTYKEKMDSFKDAWLEKHPEYKPENDPDDVRWNALNNVLNTYFKAPPKPEEITSILDKAHEWLNPRKTLPVKSSAKTIAAKEKISVSSKGYGGGSSTQSQRSSKVSSDMKQYLQGFDDDELEDIIK